MPDMSGKLRPPLQAKGLAILPLLELCCRIMQKLPKGMSVWINTPPCYCSVLFNWHVWGFHDSAGVTWKP